MAKMSGDHQTLDILTDWTPPEVVAAYAPERVRTSTLRSKIARAVAETLTDSEMTRADIAKAMSDWLEEDVSKNMLDAYASEAREEHTIPFLRLLALVHVTGDVRLLQLGAETFGHVVADAKYLAWIRVGMQADRREQAARLSQEVERDFEVSLRAARTGASS